MGALSFHAGAEGLPGGEARLGYITRPGFKTRTRTRAMIGVKINQ